MSKPIPWLVKKAVDYLRRHGEEVEPTGLGLFRVGLCDVCTAQDIITYADELRCAEKQPPLGNSPSLDLAKRKQKR